MPSTRLWVWEVSIETASATAKYLRQKIGVKVGTLHVTSFRPFPGAEIVDALKNVKALAILERMDNPDGAVQSLDQLRSKRHLPTLYPALPAIRKSIARR